jgi:hypothetical protein
VQSSFPQVDLRFAFKSHSTISRNFSFKDGIDKEMKSKIVYRINCLDCEKFYIGKTKRQFKQIKIEQKLLDNSSVHKHMTEERHRIDWDDMQVIDTARDDRRLLLKELCLEWYQAPDFLESSIMLDTGDDEITCQKCLEILILCF